MEQKNFNLKKYLPQIAFLLLLLVSCNPAVIVKDHCFNYKDFPHNKNSLDDSCEFNYSFNNERNVDVLFVLDNSGSMYPEQQEGRIADNFLGLFDNLKDKTAKVATITTNASRIEFSELKVDSNPTVTTDKLKGRFQRADTRICFEEAVSCSSTSKSALTWPLPSDCTFDGFSNSCNVNGLNNESGIDNAVTALENYRDFFRSNSRLEVIFVSDEDDEFSTRDLPESIKNLWGEEKHYGIHSVVVKENSCVESQNNQFVSSTAYLNDIIDYGSMGNAYTNISTTSYDLCNNNDYSGIVNAMNDPDTGIQSSINHFPLACSSPKEFEMVENSGDTKKYCSINNNDAVVCATQRGDTKLPDTAFYYNKQRQRVEVIDPDSVPTSTTYEFYYTCE